MGKSLESGGEASRTLCLHLPKLLMKCKCLGEFDIIGPQKLARVLRKRHAMAHTGHTPTAFQSRERRRCQSPLGDSNGRAAIRAPRLRRLMDFHLLRHSYGTYRAAIPSGCSWRGLPQAQPGRRPRVFSSISAISELLGFIHVYASTTPSVR